VSNRFVNEYDEHNSVLVWSSEDNMSSLDEYKTGTMDIVSKVAYLAGVPKIFFDKEDNPLKLSIYEELEENKKAKKIRTLSKIRNTIIKNIDAVDSRMVYEMKNINSMPDLFDNEEIEYLHKNGVSLFKVNYRAINYLIDLNKYIASNINGCKEIFPLWVEWEYIKDLFIMSKGLVPDAVRNEIYKFINNINDYPYHVYLSWAPKEKGNIFYNDKKFLDLLYEHNGAKFIDYKKVTDASLSTKDRVYKYFEENDDIVIVVDCENSNPYKLYSVLHSLNEKELIKIKKLILVDDIHTTVTWQILDSMLMIPVEHIMIERINENKSLTDMKVATATCKEHYVNSINSFILCSSDSDYWALITSLSDANFLVLIEDIKCGVDIKREMDKSGIVYCSMDEFTDGNINKIKIKALTLQIEQYIKERINLNVNEMIDYAYTTTRIEMSESEKRQFYDNHIKNMRLTIRPDGRLELILN